MNSEPIEAEIDRNHATLENGQASAEGAVPVAEVEPAPTPVSLQDRPASRLRPELREIFEKSWARNEEALRYLAR